MSTYIKKLVMHGFKSFARRTEIPLENSMNVIVGPNGSGKSNITDALCFVLGRLSIKSIRAAKAANLLFSGNKIYKGAKEAYVEIVFDNQNKTFAIEEPELVVRRIVRKTGLSIYKINGQTKTRQELLEILAQGGIDPHGFNIVLQGEIQSLVKSTPEERRKIIEDVAGISIYESRKEKSLRELEKTEEKLKEATTTLKARESYLKNLEKERQQALVYQKLEGEIKNCKASIFKQTLDEKEKEIWAIDKDAENKNQEIQKIKRIINEKNISVDELQDKIEEINRLIQDSTSHQQELLHRELAELKADSAGLNVRRENFEAKRHNGLTKIEENNFKIKELEKELEEIQTTSPEIKQKQAKLKEAQEKFDRLEKERRRYYIIKSEISNLENNRMQREKRIIENKKELELIERHISQLFEELKYAESLEQASSMKSQTRQKIEEIKEQISKFEDEQLKKERKTAINEELISQEEKMQSELTKLDICPLCQNQVTEEHIKEVVEKSNKKIASAKKENVENLEFRDNVKQKIHAMKETQHTLEIKINEIDLDIFKIKNSDEKKAQIKKIHTQISELEKEIKDSNEKLFTTRKEFEKLKNVETDYDETRLKLQELSFTDFDVDTKLQVKRQEINRLKFEIKTLTREIEESENELKKIREDLAEKAKLIEKKSIEEQELYDKFQKFFQQKNELQDKQKALETEIMGMRHEIRMFEERINYLQVQKAQYTAQIDAIKTELNELGQVEIIKAPTGQLKERLAKAQFRITQLGNVNLKALEVFDQIQEQVEQIKLKVETVSKEKEQIMKIIEEIDKKKRKAFLSTLDAINTYFTRNYAQLSRKGEISLELENPKEPFEGGLNIIVKVSKGKYFDIASLSGGEKTMVALSLIFAIQEYKPYSFYVFDEIDAALDKHNSELLAALIKQYRTSGQYLIVTHNDTLISEATTLYGVSMQESISKIISLKV